MTLTRRRALLGLSAMLAIPATGYLYVEGLPRRESPHAGERELASEEIELIAWIADDILPRTDTPGAVDVGVPSFIDMLFRDWLLPEEQIAFRNGLAALDRESRDSFGHGYADLPEAGRLHLLGEWDRLSAPAPAGSDKGGSPPFFRRLKAAVIVGYFTSEAGQNRALKPVMGAGQNDPDGPVGGSVLPHV